MGTLVPRVHAVEDFIGLMNHEDWPFGQHIQVGVGDDGRDFNDLVAIGVEAGHFHINPDQIELVGAARGRLMRFVCL